MSRYLDFVVQAERDYGVTMTPAGVRLFSRMTRVRSSGMTQRQYVGACPRSILSGFRGLGDLLAALA